MVHWTKRIIYNTTKEQRELSHENWIWKELLEGCALMCTEKEAMVWKRIRLREFELRRPTIYHTRSILCYHPESDDDSNMEDNIANLPEPNLYSDVVDYQDWCGGLDWKSSRVSFKLAYNISEASRWSFLWEKWVSYYLCWRRGPLGSTGSSLAVGVGNRSRAECGPSSPILQAEYVTWTDS